MGGGYQKEMEMARPKKKSTEKPAKNEGKEQSEPETLVKATASDKLAEPSNLTKGLDKAEAQGPEPEPEAAPAEEDQTENQ